MTSSTPVLKRALLATAEVVHADLDSFFGSLT